jgi:quercetin dioxygenase-like cupin family protein
MNFYREADLKTKEVKTGISLRAVWGEKVMVTMVRFKPNTDLPMHKHPHEQITFIAEGELEMTVGGITKLLKTGEGVVIASNEEHSARSRGPCLAVDSWHPVREDYKVG